VSSPNAFIGDPVSSGITEWFPARTIGRRLKNANYARVEYNALAAVLAHARYLPFIKGYDIIS
jgi:hypothetical protein